MESGKGTAGSAEDAAVGRCKRCGRGTAEGEAVGAPLSGKETAKTGPGLCSGPGPGGRM